jgi:hypothetical protein
MAGRGDSPRSRLSCLPHLFDECSFPLRSRIPPKGGTPNNAELQTQGPPEGAPSNEKVRSSPLGGSCCASARKNWVQLAEPRSVEITGHLTCCLDSQFQWCAVFTRLASRLLSLQPKFRCHGETFSRRFRACLASRPEKREYLRQFEIHLGESGLNCHPDGRRAVRLSRYALRPYDS